MENQTKNPTKGQEGEIIKMRVGSPGFRLPPALPESSVPPPLILCPPAPSLPSTVSLWPQGRHPVVCGVL